MEDGFFFEKYIILLNAITWRHMKLQSLQHINFAGTTK
jgi:hypothetical protein